MLKKGKMILILALILIVFLSIRFVSPSQIDDVSPERLCEPKFLEKSDIFLVIPRLYNHSISDNLGWCEQIKAFNKTLGMHGVSHDGKEFMHPMDKQRVEDGMEEFHSCFGFYPSIFEAPELSISKENKKMLEEMNFTIISKPEYLLRKAYHCTDNEKKSWLVKLNYLNDFI